MARWRSCSARPQRTTWDRPSRDASRARALAFPRTLGISLGAEPLADDVRRAMNGLYDAEVAAVDDALGALFDLVRDVNTAIDARQISAADAAIVRAAVEEFDLVLGVIGLRRAEDAQPPVPIDEIERLIDEHRAARQRRDFKAADAIRDGLAERGILLEDNPGGTRWKRK